MESKVGGNDHEVHSVNIPTPQVEYQYPAGEHPMQDGTHQAQRAELIEKVDINHHFDGGLKYSFSLQGHYRQPRAATRLPDEELVFHRDVLQRETKRPKDLERHINPVDGKPRRLFVQATELAYSSDQGPWRRVKLRGNAPKLLRLAAWATGSTKRRETGSSASSPEELMFAFARSLVVSPVMALLLLFPTGGAGSPSPFYPGVPTKCWEYPKHARNALDAAPGAPTERLHVDQYSGTATYDIASEHRRLLAPRVLIVYKDGRWIEEEQGRYGKGLQYLFVSFAGMHFPGLEEKQRLEAAAQHVCHERGLPAYWLDFRCRAATQPHLTDDIHRICDVTRGASAVYVFLPDDQPQRLVEWGNRLWTLAEALLAREHEITVLRLSPRSVPTVTKYSLLDLPSKAWRPFREGADPEEEAEDFRLLAEHFTGTIPLSRLELISVALRALRSRAYTPFNRGDVAYALMALLHVRPKMDPTDTEAQALARLSLANDSDRIVERMACLFCARAGAGGAGDLFSARDEMGARLWDVQPTCQVAGVCSDGGIILDGCHGISIRWQDVPRIVTVRKVSMSRKLARLSVRLGGLLLIVGAVATAFLPGFAVILVIGIVLVLSSPWLIENLYNGKVWDQTPLLIGFEGTMSLTDIERTVFGNAIGRLNFSPSGSTFAHGRPDERIGETPRAEGDLPEGHRCFTLIDSGSMTVTVFSAKKPPSVAFICGKEGGMLRTLLCSYDRERNAFVRQAVIRMETPTMSKAGLLGWVKLLNE